jgi:predicted polyphosphate/ATP-dependent NAD kinase
MILSLVGIIANPASGKDIRRLVAYGSVFDNQEKVRILRRVLIGLAAAGVERIRYMQDYFGIVDRALSRIDLKIPITALNFRLTGTQEDSIQAARMLADEGAACLVTLGGDGTNRAVVKGNASIPILPISTGTNNVFPTMVEGTIAGLAAGLVARQLVPLAEVALTHTKLEVLLDGRVVDLALVDAVVYDSVFVASRAIWDMDRVRMIFLNRAGPENIGISSIGGWIRPVAPADPMGLCLELGRNGRVVKAAVAPGMIREVVVSAQSVMPIGQECAIHFSPSVLALDGEREVEVRRGQQAAIRLVKDGPTVVDVTRAMHAAMERHIFSSEMTGQLSAC